MMRYEWVCASDATPELVPPEEVQEISDDGNEHGDWGIAIAGRGNSDGAMLYGALENLTEFLEQALNLVQQKRAEQEAGTGGLIVVTPDEWDRMGLSDNECEGHESLDGAHMGESVYCDGSCRKGEQR